MPGKGLFYGMASINPHFKDEEVYDELKRCVKELGFVGVKITPIAHAGESCLKRWNEDF